VASEYGQAEHHEAIGRYPGQCSRRERLLIQRATNDASFNVRHRNDERQSSLDMDGNTMMALVEELFPICRSIIGNGQCANDSFVASEYGQAEDNEAIGRCPG
jgi:hypothetical protein